MLNIGKKIKSLRQERGWTQGDVANRLGITVAAFSKIETDVTDVSLSRIQTLAGIFEVSVAELLGLDMNAGAGDSAAELSQAKEAIERLSSKVSHLQEYIITLYEELHKTKAELKQSE